MPLGLQTFVQSFYRDFFIDYDTVSQGEGNKMETFAYAECSSGFVRL